MTKQVSDADIKDPIYTHDQAVRFVKLTGLDVFEVGMSSQEFVAAAEKSRVSILNLDKPESKKIEPVETGPDAIVDWTQAVKFQNDHHIVLKSCELDSDTFICIMEGIRQKEAEQDEQREIQTATVTMNVVDWHQLLVELEHNIRIANRDISSPKQLYENICLALGTKIIWAD